MTYYDSMKRIVAASLVAALALSGTVASVAPSRPAKAGAPRSGVTVLRLGDSRTIGVGSSWGDGYAPELQRLLGREGLNVTYTPSTAGTGWCVQSLRTGIDAAMASNPDVAILAIGTNNAAGTTGTGGCMAMTGFEPAYLALVRRILALSPTVKLIIAEIQYSSAPWAHQEVYANVAAIHASWLPECDGRCTLVDLSGISRCGGLSGDNVHPTDAGYQQMASELARGVLSAYGLSSWPSVIQRGGPRPGFEVPKVRIGNGC